MAGKKEMKELRDRLVAQGFKVERARNGHYKVTAPNGRKVQICGTPSDWRGVLNTETQLARMGYKRPRKH